MAANRPLRGLATAACGLSLAALPAFLVGGLAPQIRAEMGFTETQLGLALSAAFLAGALVGPMGGRVADTIGPRWSVALGALFSAASLIGLGIVAGSYLHIALLLGVSGLSFSLMDPGLAILVTRALPRPRHGLAFGVKEASVPLATLVAGLAVPSIALTHGWRWAFLLGILPLSGLVWLLARIHLPVSPGHDKEEVGIPPGARLRTVAVAAALGSTAASGIGVFLTESAVAMGLSPANAGLLLALGGVAGIASRLLTGVLADRRGDTQLGLIALMLAVGAASIVVGSLGHPAALVVGTMGTFAGAWGWTGLLFLSLVRAAPASPGAAAGIGLAGLAVGNAVGPLAFGVAAASLGYRTAWVLAAVLAAAGSLLFYSVRTVFDPIRVSPAG